MKIVLPLEGIDQNKDNVIAALDRISVTEREKDANKIGMATRSSST